MTATAIADKSISLLDLAYKYTKGSGGGMFGFVSGGFNYLFVFNPYVKPAGCGEIFTYIPTTAEPTWVMKDDKRVKIVAEFTRDTFDAFIEAFCLDGKLLKESLRSQTTSPQNYTSYHHPDQGFSVLDKVNNIRDVNLSLPFEYNGLKYSIYFNTKSMTCTQYIHGAPFRYLMPCGDSDGERKKLIEFNADDCYQFIRTYEIEGKTLEWILEHQREWKYAMDAPHLEGVLGVHCFGFAFVYRNIPCLIPEWSETEGEGRHYHLYIWINERFDASTYAPKTPGARYWMDGYRCAISSNEYISLGPYPTINELLDKVRFGPKSLRELFDTEYDDGDKLYGCYDP